MANQTNTLFGSNQKGTRVQGNTQQGVDPYKDTPFFAPNMEQDSEHMKSFPKGSSVIGIYDGIRVANKDKSPREQYKYVLLKNEDGSRCRLKAMGNLPWILEESGRITKGMLIEIVYEGKQATVKFPDGVNTFSVFEIQRT